MTTEKTLSTEELYNSWKKGELSQEILFEELSKHARAICLGKIPEFQQEIEDIVQESVLKAFSGKFKGKSLFSTWFHRIVLNECKMFLRGKQQRDSTFVPYGVEYPDVNYDLETSLLLKLDLDKEEEEFVLLYANYSASEVAEELGTTEEAVRKRWQRLREKYQYDK